MIEADPVANQDQISYWNEISGPKWVRLTDVIHRQIEPLGREAMDRARVAAGERVLDVGCGCGQTSLDLRERVGEAGSVTGIDVSGPMLEDARRRADEAAAKNLEFLQSDAQTHAFDAGTFDLVFSRFGVMFFDDPVAAFANLRTILRPAGRVVFLCWQPIVQNPWMLVPAQAVAQHLELPPPPEPGAPGPFAFADSERVLRILESAGFAEPRCESLERDLVLGAGMAFDEVVSFMMELGPAGAALRDAPLSAAEAVRGSVREALSPYRKEDGLRMSAAAWLVSARTPG